jgi:predicted lipid carrier protein YhbT
VSENSIGIQEYVESYIPGLIGKRLEEKPVPGMEGTEFTFQLIIEGEQSIAYGITIKDARHISVAPGKLENPMMTMTLTEDMIRRMVDQVSAFTGRNQYDTVKQAKGTLHLEMAMPGDWSMPLDLTFNGASEPSVTISGSAEVFQKIAAGELNGPAAFMQGQIKMDGDMAFALSIANLMPGGSF